jgi:hypothetical protein
MSGHGTYNISRTTREILSLFFKRALGLGLTDGHENFF